MCAAWWAGDSRPASTVTFGNGSLRRRLAQGDATTMTGLPTDSLRDKQWHLQAAGYPVPAIDINVLPVWPDYIGRGVLVGI